MQTHYYRYGATNGANRRRLDSLGERQRANEAYSCNEGQQQCWEQSSCVMSRWLCVPAAAAANQGGDSEIELRSHLHHR